MSYAAAKRRLKANVGLPCGRCKAAPRQAYHSWCRNCQETYDYSWRLRTRFEMTPGEYEALLQQQGGVCAICQNPPKKRRLDLDHNHKTGAIRGLLCHRCNRALPFFRDRADVLARAAEYVRLSL